MQKFIFTAFLTFASFLAVNLVFSNSCVYAQSIETINDLSIDLEKFTTSPNISKLNPSNTTKIMENTSGMIDDAFDIIKDTFGSFFGK